MLDAALQGLGHLGLSTILLMFLAAMLCQIVVSIPGLGGPFVIVILLPFVVGLEPTLAIAILVAGSVVSGTGNTITSVLFGVPGSSMGVASVFDGYPMAQRGEAGRALGAGFGASLVGGIVGAIILALMLPIVRPLVLAVSSPEFFVLVLSALVFIAYVGRHDMNKALIAGGFGLLISFIGQEPSTGSLRYTFGQLYLWDGIELVPLMIGLYAITEMILLINTRSTIAQTEIAPVGGAWAGFLDVFRHWRATVTSSVVGVVVGIVPGLGGETAQFLAYTQVAKTSKNRAKFGEGEVEGVIAADACTNSKDGGALIPTLALGIPGSSGMAVLLVALIALGVTPGTELLTNDLDIVYMIMWALIFANVFATGFCMFFANRLAKLTFVRGALVVAPVLAVSFFGGFAATFTVADLLVVIGAGFGGFFMVRFGYSRATLVIGFVLGRVLEQHLLLSMRIYGWQFVFRPITLIIILAVIGTVAGPSLYAMWTRRRAPRSEDADRPDRAELHTTNSRRGDSAP